MVSGGGRSDKKARVIRSKFLVFQGLFNGGIEVAFNNDTQTSGGN